MIISRGGAAAAYSLAALVAPLKSRSTSRDPGANYVPTFNSRARSFSNSSSCLILFVPFVAIVQVSNLAIAVATAFLKSLAVLPSTRDIR